jgi:hypothetical protein
VSMKEFDQPLLLLFALTIGVLSMAAVLGWFAVSMGWTGIAGYFKQGVAG